MTVQSTFHGPVSPLFLFLPICPYLMSHPMDSQEEVQYLKVFFLRNTHCKFYALKVEKLCPSPLFSLFSFLCMSLSLSLALSCSHLSILLGLCHVMYNNTHNCLSLPLCSSLFLSLSISLCPMDLKLLVLLKFLTWSEMLSISH